MTFKERFEVGGVPVPGIHGHAIYCQTAYRVHDFSVGTNCDLPFLAEADSCGADFIELYALSVLMCISALSCGLQLGVGLVDPKHAAGR